MTTLPVLLPRLIEVLLLWHRRRLWFCLTCRHIVVIHVYVLDGDVLYDCVARSIRLFDVLVGALSGRVCPRVLRPLWLALPTELLLLVLQQIQSVASW